MVEYLSNILLISVSIAVLSGYVLLARLMQCLEYKYIAKIGFTPSPYKIVIVVFIISSIIALIVGYFRALYE